MAVLAKLVAGDRRHIFTTGYAGDGAMPVTTASHASAAMAGGRYPGMLQQGQEVQHATAAAGSDRPWGVPLCYGFLRPVRYLQNG